MASSAPAASAASSATEPPPAAGPGTIMPAPPASRAAPRWPEDPPPRISFLFFAAAAAPGRVIGAAGVGSKGTQPMPAKNTSTHEWASSARIFQVPDTGSYDAGAKPDATRAGIPSMRSSSVIAPENCWQ